MADTGSDPINPRAYFRRTVESLRAETEEIRNRATSASGDVNRLALAECELRIVEAELAALEQLRDASPHRR